MSQGFGQGGGYSYQGPNQWGQQQGFNPNPNQGWNNN